MVGSRSPTPSGRSTAREFAAWFARAGLTVTSGLALGIDAASHEGALSVEGLTVAVSGTGLDRVYPQQHEDLAARIRVRGALVSEFPPRTAPLRQHFPRRNRIISGLALGTLVVEAARHRGARCLRSRAPSTVRSRAAATNSCATARSWWRKPRTFWRSCGFRFRKKHLRPRPGTCHGSRYWTRSMKCC